MLPRPDADNRELSPRSPCQLNDRFSCAGQGAGGAQRLAFFNGQSRLWASYRQRRPFGYAVAADLGKHYFRRVLQLLGLGFQLCGRKHPKRHPEPPRRLYHRRLIRLQVQRGHTGNRLGRNISKLQAFLHQRPHLPRITAPRTAKAKRKALRMIGQHRWLCLHGGLGGDEFYRTSARFKPPDIFALNDRCLPAKHCHHHRLSILGVGQPPAHGRLVERDTKRHITRCCYRCMALQRVGNLLGKAVRPVVAAEQRDYRGAVIRYRNYGRLGAFIG